MKFWFATLLFLFTVNASASLPQQSQWQFKVLLDSREIGSHQFTVSRANGQQTIQTDASFDVKVLFVNLYRYRHQNTEVWQGNCLRSINAETDANGKQFSVAGQANDSYFQVNTASTETELPACIMTFAYWNPAFLTEDKLLNSQTGEYEDVTITRVGEESLRVNDEAVAAVRYLIDLKAGPITLWYGASDFRWLALESVAAGGRTLRYEPLTIPPSGSGQALSADSTVSKIGGQ
ncbi:DUF6134 family protein [bacterium]|nr:DUF6134 family protein [bacterium]